MNGMRQGLIIGAVAGLFFGFMLGRFGTKHTGGPAIGTQKTGSRAQARAITKESQLPRNYLRSNQLKNVNWKGLSPRQKAWGVKVLNEVPCQCGKRRYNMAQCLRFARRCKPNMKKVKDIMSEVRRGVHYTRILAKYSPRRRRGRSAGPFVAPKVKNAKAFLARTARYAVPKGNGPSMGPKNALVTIVEFSDFQCPFCTRGANTVKKIFDMYKGKVRVEFRHMPLSFHKQAHLAAQASMFANSKGKFWKYHDILFANRRALYKPNLLKYAKELGMNAAEMKKALDSGKYKAVVDADMRLGQRYGRGTPTFLINGRRLVGAQPINKFRKVVEEELQVAKYLLDRGVKVSGLYERLLSEGKKAAADARKRAAAAARRRREMANKRVNIPVGKAPSWGPANAKVTVVEFSDFQCPFCTRGARVVDQIKKAYPGKVRVVFKHLPLYFHKQAHIAAQASMAANEQGKFWAYHDKLFANYRRINKSNLIKWAGELKLNVAKFTAALNSGKYKKYVDSDLALARRVGANGTPTFFVNGKRLVGAQPFPRFKALIDSELKNPGKARKIPSIARLRVLKPLARRLKLRVIKRTKPGTSPVDIKTAPSWGNPKAPVWIVEFSDFQCPFCSRGARVIDQIKKEYGKNVRVFFKHLPLSFHKQAHLAAQASMAANAQGKFWPYHDKLFQNSRRLYKNDLIRYAKEVGLDVKRFTADINSGKYKSAVDKDLIQASRAGARGTPTFFINGERLVGAQPFSKFKTVIDRALGIAPAPRIVAPSGAGVNTKGAPSWGPANAKVTIVEFSDFQCPFCNRGARVMDQVKKAYGNKVRIVFKHLPLSFHKQAHIAAQASMAANEQGKFWPYHDKLFRNYRNINKANLVKWARELGLNMAKFNAALNSGKYKAYVDKDAREAASKGANGTPTFLVNGQKIVGAQPFSRFKAAIDAALSGKKIPSAAPRRRPRRPSGPVKLNTKGAPSWGPANAKITIVEFSDFQCPFCTRGARTIEQLKKQYAGKLRVVFKHQPLSFHKQAHIAAQASMAANEQGKFWQYHDKLFQNSRRINKANLIKWAAELKLDVAKFKAALDSGKYKKYVDNDQREANGVGANGTPTFFINGNKLVGAQPISRFKSMIDALLAGKKIPSAAPRRPRRPAPSGPVKINTKGSPSWGPANAKVTIVEFSDFQCPFCTRGARTIEQLKKQYAGKLRVVFKHQPLSFHRQAHIAAQASMAANAQGKFWEYHDILFKNSRSINKANLIKWAGQLKLDVAKFKAALDKGTYKAFVDKDQREANSVGANGTPTFFINGIKLVGAQPIFRFKSMIDAALSGKKIPTAAPRRPRRPKPSGPVKINTKGAPSWGPANAKVTVVEFSDFQCPFCSRGARVVEQIKKAYPGKVRVVFKHLPLSFHRQAHIAAQASMAANAQGKFWQYHDKLFANYRSINKANLIKWAGELKLDVAKFKAALDKGTYKAYVDKDAREAGAAGANGTPTFFVNGNKIVGAQPFPRFKSMIDAALSGKKIPSAAPRRRPRRPSGPVKVKIGNAPAWGPANAPVTIVEFSDFQCPFCTRGANTVRQIKKAYGNKIRVVFKHLPLSFHKQAHIAAQAAMAANEQGKFWQYHDKLFANYRNINKANLIKWAGELKLDLGKFKAALDSGKYKKYVDTDAAYANSIGANGTPTFFINGNRLVGAQPFARFKTVIDAELKKAKK